MNALPDEEFCPRCGHWVTRLDLLTGWCDGCTRRTNHPLTTTGSRHCSACNTTQPLANFSAASHRCRACDTDQKRRWREANRERETRYQASRRRGRCPSCNQNTWLTKSGFVTNHMLRVGTSHTSERCPGSGGLPILEAAP